MAHGFLSRDKKPPTYRGIGELFGVTPERVRQILAKADRKLRHSSRLQFFQPFIVPYTHSDMRASLAREELFGKLCKNFNESLSYEITMRITRKHLTGALKAASQDVPKELNRLLAYSCFYQNMLGPCVLCDEPALPNFNWCLVHMGESKKIVLLCDGCGVRFTRHPSTLISYTKRMGRTQWGVFHSKNCLFTNGSRVGIFAHTGKGKSEVLLNAR